MNWDKLAFFWAKKVKIAIKHNFLQIKKATLNNLV